MITGRLVGLRPIEEGDLEVMTALANDPRIRATVVGWNWMVSPSIQRDWLQSSSTSSVTKRLTVVDKADRRPIGMTGLWHIDWHNRSAMAGIKLLPENGLKGAGSDTIMLVNALSFQEVGLRRLCAEILPFNTASLRAYVERSGWIVEGRSREAIFRDGGWHDLIQVGILKSDFDAHPDAAEYARYVMPIPIQE